MCLDEKELVDAHIIPASFYRYMKPDSRPFEIRSSEKGECKKRSQTGIYDKTILCDDCEKLFQECDDYTQDLLLPDPKGAKYIVNPKGEKEGCRLDNVNYNYLKLFFLSVLWKASVSTRKEFSKINTGPFEQELKKMINGGDPGDQNTFSVTITRFNDYLGKNFLLNPHETRIDELNYYIFYLGAGYKVYIKVDRRPLSGVLAAIILKPNQPFYILFNKDFSKSKELDILRNIVRNNLN